MWGAAIGVIYGFMAYRVNAMFAARITARAENIGMYVAGLVIGKYIALLGILVGMAFVGIDVMLWTAGGCLVTLIASAIRKSIIASR